MFLLAFAAMVLGCTGAEVTKDKPVIAVSSYPMYDFVRSIVDEEDFEIWLMLPPGLNAHSYEPTPQDLVKLGNADVLVFTNRHFELWAEKTVTAAGNPELLVINASETVILLDAEENGKIVKDPHTWLSPKTAKGMVGHIADELAAKYPDKRQMILARADAYAGELEALDGRFTAVTATCRHREMFVSHAAFGYLVRDYGLEQVPIIDNFEPEGEVSLADLAELIEKAKEKNATHIFFEDYISPKLSEAVAREINGTTAIFSPVEAYAAYQLENDSYIKIMDRNLDVMREALDCE
jgi:zinc transport system substrate-binding protein